MAITKANYRTADGFNFNPINGGSVKQIASVDPNNPLTQKCYNAALAGEPIPFIFKGPGSMKAELGLSLAHSKLAELARTVGIPVPDVSSPVMQPGWPVDWNLPSLENKVAELTAQKMLETAAAEEVVEPAPEEVTETVQAADEQMAAPAEETAALPQAPGEVVEAEVEDETPPPPSGFTF